MVQKNVMSAVVKAEHCLQWTDTHIQQASRGHYEPKLCVI